MLLRNGFHPGDGMLITGAAARVSLLSPTRVAPATNLIWTQLPLPLLKLLTNHPSSSQARSCSFVTVVPFATFPWFSFVSGTRVHAGAERHGRLYETSSIKTMGSPRGWASRR